MLGLFNNTNPTKQAIIKPPDWPYVKAGLIRNVGTVISYHRKYPTAVKSNHFLVRLLQSISVPQSLNLERYHANVDAMAMTFSMAFRMTSSIYKGQIFNNVFYGPDSREIIIAVNNLFDFQKAHENWENIRAVEVFRHDMSDLSLAIPDGKDNWSESGVAVIVINIPMLAVQYRAFRQMETYYSAITGASERSVMQFIRQYVLPNMLHSHLDNAIFNRINNLLIGAPLGVGKAKHPYYLTPYEEKLNRVHHTLINHFEDTNKDFNTIMDTIPLVNKPALRELARIVDTAPTMQITWALAMMRLPILKTLIGFARKNALRKNQTEMNQVKRFVRNLRNNHTLEAMLPIDLYLEMDDELNELEKISTS
jgi:hypothetical protein